MADVVRPADMPKSLWSSTLARLGLASGGAPNRTRYFARWIALGILVGIAAGLGAIAFFWLLREGTHLLLGGLAGYAPPAPAGEGNHGASAMARPWVLPLVVALGGLLSGLTVFLLAPEAKGDGADSAIHAFHFKGGRMRTRVVPIKMLTSAITLGAGGSGGREGPAAQISAGFGSLLGQLLRLDPQDRRILVVTGIGAGIGAIFRAPLGGAVLAAELPYTHDMEVEALLPSLIASIVGYTIFGAWAGWQPIFGAQPELGFANPLQLVYYAVLGLLCGVVGVLYVRSYDATTAFFERRERVPPWLKPAAGGLLVGLIGLALPEVLGTGYGWAQLSLSPNVLRTIPLWVIVLLPFAKILTTSLTVGSGGSAGLFGPGVVIGAFVGTAFWGLGHTLLPGMPASPAPFSIIAMMALFGGIVHAPLAIMLMVAEMTGNLSLLAPAMIAVFLAALLAGDHTIYHAQLPTRADSPAHRYQFSFPLLNTLPVRDAMSRLNCLLRPEMTVADAASELTDHGLPGAPVTTHDRQLLGVLTQTDIDSVPSDDRAATSVDAIMTSNPVTVDVEAGLDVALEQLATHRVSWAPVVEARDQVAGVITAADIVAAYRAALRWTVRRLRGITADTVLLEARLTPESALAGKALRELRLPGGALVVSIHRNGTTILPRGSSTLESGDLVSVLTSPESEAAVRDYLGDVSESRSIAAGFS